MSEKSEMLIAALLVFGLPSLFVASIFLSGATFGQRCANYYDGLQWERCVAHLAEGGDIWTVPSIAEARK